MSVTFYVHGHDAAELNVANGNFVRLMRLIGEERRDWQGQFPVVDLPHLRERVRFVLSSLQAMPDLDGGIPDQQLAPNYVECGLPPGYFVERLTQLLALIDHALSAGEDLIYG